MHERALLATTNQDTDQVTGQDKSLKNKGTGQDTLQDTDQVTDQVEQLVAVLTGEMSRASIQAGLELKDRPHFIESYLTLMRQNQQRGVATKPFEFGRKGRPEGHFFRSRPVT